MLSLVRLSTGTSAVLYPTADTVSTSVGRAEMLKSPSMPVATPVLVPFTITLAPITGSFCPSTTVPLITDCAVAAGAINKASANTHSAMANLIALGFIKLGY